MILGTPVILFRQYHLSTRLHHCQPLGNASSLNNLLRLHRCVPSSFSISYAGLLPLFLSGRLPLSVAPLALFGPLAVVAPSWRLVVFGPLALVGSSLLLLLLSGRLPFDCSLVETCCPPAVLLPSGCRSYYEDLLLRILDTRNAVSVDPPVVEDALSILRSKNHRNSSSSTTWLTQTRTLSKLEEPTLHCRTVTMEPTLHHCGADAPPLSNSGASSTLPSTQDRLSTVKRAAG